MSQEVWKDNTIMPGGKYKGVALANIPASHFIWLYDIYGVDKNSPLGIYIKNNIDAIRIEYAKDKEQQKKQYKHNAR